MARRWAEIATRGRGVRGQVHEATTAGLSRASDVKMGEQPVDPDAASGPGARTRVIAVTGTGRSGSTLLAQILGSYDEVFSAGELRYVWSRGITDDQFCGCGQRFSQCPTWTKVLDSIPSAVDRAPHIESVLQQHVRLRALANPLRPPGVAVRNDHDVRTSLEALYRAIAQTTGSVIVDSSKPPSYTTILTGIESLDVRVVHLVRDPRGVAWSWGRGKATRGVEEFGSTMARYSPMQVAVRWSLGNAGGAWWLGRRSANVPYMRVRYEDFMSAPQAVVEEIAAFAGLEGDVPVHDGNVADLAPCHTVAGNPNRMRHGPTPLHLDREWQNRLPRRARTLVGAVTWPVRASFGYRGADR